MYVYHCGIITVGNNHGPCRYCFAISWITFTHLHRGLTRWGSSSESCERTKYDSYYANRFRVLPRCIAIICISIFNDFCIEYAIKMQSCTRPTSRFIGQSWVLFFFLIINSSLRLEFKVGYCVDDLLNNMLITETPMRPLFYFTTYTILRSRTCRKQCPHANKAR